jgi:hypothetical protein
MHVNATWFEGMKRARELFTREAIEHPLIESWLIIQAKVPGMEDPARVSDMVPPNMRAARRKWGDGADCFCGHGGLFESDWPGATATTRPELVTWEHRITGPREDEGPPGGQAWDKFVRIATEAGRGVQELAMPDGSGERRQRIDLRGMGWTRTIKQNAIPGDRAEDGHFFAGLWAFVVHELAWVGTPGLRADCCVWDAEVAALRPFPIFPTASPWTAPGSGTRFEHLAKLWGEPPRRFASTVHGDLFAMSAAAVDAVLERVSLRKPFDPAPKPGEPGDLITRTKAAEIAECSERTIARRVNKNVLQTFKGGKVSRAEVLAKCDAIKQHSSRPKKSGHKPDTGRTDPGQRGHSK